MTHYRKQTVSINQNRIGSPKENTLSVHTGDITPSWKRYGDGVANITFEATGLNPEKPYSGWMQIIVSETAFADDDKPNGRDITKEVWNTLNVEAMIALRDMLNGLNLDK